MILNSESYLYSEQLLDIVIMIFLFEIVMIFLFAIIVMIF